MTVQFDKREAWSAKAPTSSTTPWKEGTPKGLVVHWVGGGAMNLHTKPHTACLAAVRGIESYEMSRGYISIAYNLLACPHGILIEGRGLSCEGAANGGGVNGLYASICLLMGQGDPFLDEYKPAIVEARNLFGGSLLSHRQVNATQCPSDAVADWVFAQAPQPIQMPVAVMPQKPNPSAGGNLVNVYVALNRLATTILTGPVVFPTQNTGIRDIQFALVGGFGQKIKIDGINGPATVEAIKNAQRFGKLKADGIVGSKTRKVLSSVLKVKYP